MVSLSKRNKQILSILILIFMMFNSLMPVVSAIEFEKFVYEDEDKTVISGYRGGGDVVIPENVTTIRSGAFKDKKIRSLILNEGLEYIESEAFSNNSISGEIVLPSTIKRVEDMAFADNGIEMVDFSKIDKDVYFGESVFQDNKISGEVDLSNLVNIPKGMFMNNEIEDVIFAVDLEEIKMEAFLNNKLSKVNIMSDKAKLKRDVFASNGQYVAVSGVNVSNDRSEYHSYGHIVNPINIIVRSIVTKPDGSKEVIKSDREVLFNPYEADNFFSLNSESFYRPDYILDHVIDKDIHKDGVVSFVPDKDYYVVDVFYKKEPNPTINVNKDAIQDLLNNKKEGSNISEENLLSLITAKDYMDMDITDDVIVFPKEIVNAEAKEYNVVYSVKDTKGRTAEYKLTLPIAIDPFKIKIANTEWQLEDFIYEGNSVAGLSDSGKGKAKITSGLAIPHINPYTMESIEVVDFGEVNLYPGQPMWTVNRIRSFIKEGDILFGDVESIKEIKDASFIDTPIKNLPDMPNLEHVGDWVFVGTQINGQFPNMPNLKHIGNSAFEDAEISGKLPDMPKLEYIGDRAFWVAQISGELPDMPMLEYIGYNAFFNTDISGQLSNMPMLEHIGDQAFQGTQISGQLPDMPNLKHIGNYAFYRTDILGQLPDMPNLKHIGNSAFRSLKQLSGQLPSMPKLEYVGYDAFKDTQVSGKLTDMPNLKYIGYSAFLDTQISGQLPDMPKLEYIGDGAFRYTGISGQLPSMPMLEHVGDRAFLDTQISGQLPIMPKLEHIGVNAFRSTGILGRLPDMPKLEYIGDNAFYKTGISDQLPNMPKLEHIGNQAFDNTGISGQLPNMPNLEHIGNNAFDGTQLSGQLPSMPKLKHIGSLAFFDTDISGQLPSMPNLEYLGNLAFWRNDISGELPDMPNLEHIGDMAFDGTKISGHLPDMPKLKHVGYKVFWNTSIKKDKPFYINNDTKAEEASFQISNTDNTQLILLTRDGKNAPGVPESDYHVLNPKTVFLIGKNKNNETILDKTSALAREDGSNLIITPPNVDGYIDSGDVKVSKSSLVDNTYTHIYKSYKDKIDEAGGNKYQFKFTPITREGLYGDGQVVNTQLSLSTVNENMLNNGKIEVIYNDKVFEDFYIPKTKGIEDINYSDGKIAIELDKNLSQGTEIAIPVSFKIKAGVISKEYPLDTTLLDGDNILGYDHVSYGPLHVEPVFKSTFDKKDKRVEYKNIVTSDLSEDYSTSVTLYPSIVNFVRDFESIEIRYSGLEYKRKDGSIQRMDTQSNNWKSYGNGFILKLDSFDENSIEPLTLDIANPAKTDEAIIVKSRAIIKYKDESGKVKTLTLEDENELNIHPEERYGNILAKNIRGPHYNGRHSYFYDNDIERKDEFHWDLLYRITQDLDELTLTDHSLDNRMKFTSVDPNGKKVLAVFYENENELTRINISDKYIIDKDIQENVDKIELRYYNLNKGDEVRPIIGSKIKSPNISHYKEGNPGNINSFYNKMSTRSIGKSGQVMVGSDYAFTNVAPENKQLRTVVKITSPIEDLSYGKSSTTKFSLASKDKFNKNIKEMKYTAIIEPGYRLEDVSFLNGVVGNYDVTTNKDGYTQIDFNLIDTSVSINGKESKFDLFNIVTTPEKKDNKPLIAHGLLHGSEEYEIYNKGEGIVNGLNLGDYSYSTDNAKPINGEFFSIRKLIGKEGEIGNKIITKPGEKFFYRFEIDNATSKSRDNFKIIDILPFKGDENNSAYRNEIDLTKQVKLPSGFKIEYLNQSSDLNISKNNIIGDLTGKSWSSTPSRDTKAIKVTSDRLVSNGDLITIDIPMVTKNDLKPVDNMSETINQFAYTHDTLGYKQALSNPVYQSAEVEVPKKDIKLTKISTSMGKKDGVIEGVDFILKDRGGRLVDRATTNKDGVLVFKDIPVGNYIVEESSILKGYKEKAPNIIINAEDMDKASNVLDLGEVVNERVDEFNYLLRNVELIDDLNSINYSKLGSMYSREILSGEFKVTNTDTGKSETIKINNRFGEKITLNPGKHIVEQTVTPKDNGLQYKENTIKYMFEIDKFGKIHLGTGRGDTLTGKTEVQNSIIYFPNSVDYKTSTINVNKVDEDNKPLNGAEFTLLNINTGEEITKTTVSGKTSFTGVKPGLYSLKETKAPNGYIGSDRSEIIEVLINESKTLEYKFVNKKIVVNVNKYKIVSDFIKDKSVADSIANSIKSSTNGEIVVKNIDGYYQVREVWEDNVINVNGKDFYTNSQGSVVNIEKDLSINSDTVLDIRNSTKIKNHYEDIDIKEYINDYLTQEDFDGVINIDIEVKPLKGTIYVSKYVIDENNNEEIKEELLTNGARYTLFVDKGTGSYEELETKEIDNSNYLVFKDLDPNYKYKVKEMYVPEGQEESAKKEIDVQLNDTNKYTASVVFRNYIPKDVSEISIKKIDGDTNEVLDNVEFTIQDRNGVVVQTKKTNSNGELVFDELEHDLAPYTIIETEAKNGYRLNTKPIEVTEEDLDNKTEFTVKNFKSINAPETGTLGKLPFIVISLVITVAGVFLLNKKKKSNKIDE